MKVASESRKYFCTVRAVNDYENVAIGATAGSLSELLAIARNLLTNFTAGSVIEIRRMPSHKRRNDLEAADMWVVESLPAVVRDHLNLLLGTVPIFETNSIQILEEWVKRHLKSPLNIVKMPLKKLGDDVDDLPPRLRDLLRKSFAKIGRQHTRIQRTELNDNREYLATFFETEKLFQEFSIIEKAALLALGIREIEDSGLLEDLRMADIDLASAMQSLGTIAIEENRDFIESAEIINLKFLLALDAVFLWCISRIQEADIQEWIHQNQREKPKPY